MFARFSLVLMVNHACNLRCTYCYTGAKFRRAMSRRIAETAIGRAIRSVSQGGTLELSFFGGEPLVEAELIDELIGVAESRASAAGLELRITMTTNGTIDTPAAWRVMLRPELELNVSHDGLPAVHDRHRVGPDGAGSSDRVFATIERLLAAGREPRVVMVVRPDTAEFLPDGIAWLRGHGVRHVTPSLDLWARWTRDDAWRLQSVIVRCAELWRAGLPECSISWFDDKAAMLTGVPSNETARCGFGHGEIAVAPSGNLFPCERLIGEDASGNSARLPGHALDGDDFCQLQPAGCRSADPCAECSIASLCRATCRCSNFIRTGDVRRPDGLLCMFESTCYRETARMLGQLHVLSA